MADSSYPEIGQVVSVRKKKYVVTDIQENSLDSQLINSVLIPRTHLVRLASIEDDDLGNGLSVIWQIEPGTKIEEMVKLPNPKRFDPPEVLDAFMNAVRWGSISSTDTRQLQAPFRSGIEIVDYQLEPLIRSLDMPRANLLIADDVGLGKTIEAGLIIQELLFRNRAHSVLVVCPAGLQIHWRDQMLEKFGLEFRIVDSECFRQLRRKRGIHANPWGHFPRLITSIDFIKRDYPFRRYKELLPSQVSYPRKFDILVIDEAHNIAPAGSSRYALESQRTQAIRWIVPHFEHRLFLSATPHNGYLESFTSLLELLDDQRFARGVKPNQKQLEQIMIRRLKTELVKWDGTPRFKPRIITPLPVSYSEEENHIHQLLARYHELRIQNRKSEQEKFALEFVLKLLKKRLFSSPAAFSTTLDQHSRTMQQKQKEKEAKSFIGTLRRQINKLEDTFADDDEYEQEISNAAYTASAGFSSLSEEEQGILKELKSAANDASGRMDSKSKVLIDWLKSVVKPYGDWNDERVIIFTEYRATQNYLQMILASHGFTQGNRLMMLYGGMDGDERERIKAAFQSDPAESPVRILLATDTASEGIDLQAHCHRLVHFEIPWNPNRMEQRNGRIDRHGQKFNPEIFHFVGASLETLNNLDIDSLEADLEFLWRAVKKVEQIREDLGNVGPVIADQIEEAMLGKTRTLDTTMAEMKSQAVRRLTRFQMDQKQKIRESIQRLTESRDALHISSQNVLKVVETALTLAGQPALIPAKDIQGLEGKAFYLPALRGSWQTCLTGLAHPYTGKIRPIVFDESLLNGRDDIVLAHLNHRLVQMSMRLLRAEIWAPETEKSLGRVCIRTVPDHKLNTPVALAYGRVVVIGGDNQRLHEELILAGGEIHEGGFQPIHEENTLQTLIETSQPGLVSDNLKDQLRKVWPQIEPGIMLVLEKSMESHLSGLKRMLKTRETKEVRDISAILNELKEAIQAELKEPEIHQLELFNNEERDQLQRDLDTLAFRLSQIPQELEKEVEKIKAHFANPQPRLYPVSVLFLVPEKMREG